MFLGAVWQWWEHFDGIGIQLHNQLLSVPFGAHYLSCRPSLPPVLRLVDLELAAELHALAALLLLLLGVSEVLEDSVASLDGAGSHWIGSVQEGAYVCHSFSIRLSLQLEVCDWMCFK